MQVNNVCWEIVFLLMYVFGTFVESQAPVACCVYFWVLHSFSLLHLSLLLLFLHVWTHNMLCELGCACATVGMRRSEDNFWGSVLFSPWVPESNMDHQVLSPADGTHFFFRIQWPSFSLWTEFLSRLTPAFGSPSGCFYQQGVFPGDSRF